MSEKFTPEPEVPQEEPLASKGKPEVSVKLPESPDIKIDIEKKEIIILSEGTETGEKRHPFQEFMYHLRGEGIRVSTGEWLDLQTLLAAGEVQSLDELYVVARAVLVKDAVNYPKYDVAFGKLFYGIEPPSEEEEENEDSYDEQNDYDDPQDGTESEDALREKAEVEEKEKKESKAEDERFYQCYGCHFRSPLGMVTVNRMVSLAWGASSRVNFMESWSVFSNRSGRLIWLILTSGESKFRTYSRTERVSVKFESLSA